MYNGRKGKTLKFLVIVEFPYNNSVNPFVARFSFKVFSGLKVIKLFI